MGWTDTVGGWLGMNRGNRAEDLYGGVDKNNYNLPGFQDLQSGYNRRLNEDRNFNQSYFRSGQSQLGQMLLDESRGQGVGQQVARMQAQQQADRGMAQQLAMAAGARPGMQGQAARNAAMNAGNMNAAVGGQAAMAGMQAALGAQGLYSQHLQGARNADDQAQLAMYGLNDARQMELLRQRLQAAGMQQQGSMGYEQNRTQRYGVAAGTPTSGEQLIGGAAGLATGLKGMFSDKNLKENIENADDSIDAMMHSLRPYAYDYKNKEHGERRYHGIMAQDLEKSAAGKSLVYDTPEGKMVDTTKALGTVLAGLSRLNARLSKLEK